MFYFLSLGVALLANAPEQLPIDRLKKKMKEDVSVKSSIFQSTSSST